MRCIILNQNLQHQLTDLSALKTPINYTKIESALLSIWTHLFVTDIYVFKTNIVPMKN